MSKPDDRVRRLKVLRAGSLAVLCVSLAGFVMSANHRIVLCYRGTAAGFSTGCFVAGADVSGGTGPGIGAGPVRLEYTQAWSDGFASAWRPFRAGGRRGWCAVFPMWQPLVLLAGLTAYSHGVLVGERRSDRNSCRRCGYDLRSLRGKPGAGAKASRCPECGEPFHADGRAPAAPVQT
ncbi:MAG: hypothetical protein AB7G11_07910 [Phycisphaerales bacterium]